MSRFSHTLPKYHEVKALIPGRVYFGVKLSEALERCSPVRQATDRVEKRRMFPTAEASSEFCAPESSESESTIENQGRIMDARPRHLWYAPRNERVIPAAKFWALSCSRPRDHS
jgi:hypothetical protein